MGCAVLAVLLDLKETLGGVVFACWKIEPKAACARVVGFFGSVLCVKTCKSFLICGLLGPAGCFLLLGPTRAMKVGIFGFQRA